MELAKDEKEMIIGILNQVSVPINQAQRVLNIISKLQAQLNELNTGKE